MKPQHYSEIRRLPSFIRARIAALPLTGQRQNAGSNVIRPRRKSLNAAPSSKAATGCRFDCQQSGAEKGDRRRTGAVASVIAVQGRAEQPAAGVSLAGLAVLWYWARL